MTTMFDTYAYYNTLTDQGFAPEQADALTRANELVLKEAVQQELATKDDLKALELAVQKEIKELEVSLQKDMKELELRLQKEIQQVRKEIKELEVSLQKDMKELELRLQKEIQQVRKEIKDSESHLIKWIIASFITFFVSNLGVTIAVLAFLSR